MLLSRKWLNEFVEVDASDRDFAEAMTLSGSKQEATEDLGAEIQNVVVGKILSIEKHPDSNHMFVTLIDVGAASPLQIVTGAWNIHVGDLVPVAKPGSLLPGGKRIEAGNMRGVMSSGMLCSLKELGLDTHDFAYGVIRPAALLNDYKPADPAKPSIPADIKPGDKVFGTVVCAGVKNVESAGVNLWKCVFDLGGSAAETVVDFQNIHEWDLVAYDTASGKVLGLDGLRAEQKEFPNCIDDGIFILHEPDAIPGADIRPVIGRDDHVVDFEITPNRPDCLCMIGLAREAAVTFGKKLNLHEPVVAAKAGGDVNSLARVVVEDKLCLRYTGRMVRNVKIAPSPKWMRERIRACGMRPINNIVDITNYVMMEYGQPMHAFDFSCVKDGEIHVRRARPGETIQTLDGTARALNENMLCICDTEKPVGVAGVMGGANSEIVGDTAMVLFESANFDGTSIRRTATALGMRTDASARYEKGLDPANTMLAVNRACELVELLGAGEVVEGVIDVYPDPLPQTTVKLEPDKINALLGTDIDRETMVKILTELDFTLDGDTIYVPSWRGDVEHYSDIAEEVARIYGYNNIPNKFSGGNTRCGGYSEVQKAKRLLGAECRSLGMDEIITYSFISPTYYDKIRLPADSPLRDSIKILNPLGEDTSIMRTTVLPSMMEILVRNYNFRNKQAKLYEIGRVYFKRADGLADEPEIVSIGAYGEDMDFYKLKGWVEELLRSLRTKKPEFAAEKSNPSYHPGRCAKVYVEGECVGVFGQIDPRVAKNYGVDAEFYCAELSFAAMYKLRGAKPVYQPLPRFPSINRDIAIVCDASIPVAKLEECICAAGGDYLKNVELFDVYTGIHIADGKKSVAFSLTMRSDDQTLTDEHADEILGSVLDALKTKLGAVIR
jgi:phenylalanyl-tRNA synthetase beta chain